MLTKTEFKEAFREAMEIQLATDLKESEPHEFTPGFESRMEELIRTGKPNNKKGLSKRGKRLLIIAIAAVLALTLTACAVPEIRESIAGFFVKIFSDHVEYSDPDVTKERIEEEYGLVPIPEGFAVDYQSKLKSFIQTQYSFEELGSIQLVQSAKGGIASSVDNEHGSFSEYSVGDKTVRVYYGEGSMSASWLENGYYFVLTCNFPVELVVFEDWIDSVQIIE